MTSIRAWKRIGWIWLTHPTNRMALILSGAILLVGFGLMTMIQEYRDVIQVYRMKAETDRSQWEENLRRKKVERMTVIFKPGQTDGGLLAAVDRKLSGLGLSGKVTGIEPMPVKHSGHLSMEEVLVRLRMDGTDLPRLLREFEKGDEPWLVRHLSLSRVRIGEGLINGEIRVQRLVRRE